MVRIDQLDVDRAFVLIIDLQEKLLPLIADGSSILNAARFLLAGCRVFGLPVLATEQYPQGLGPTDANVSEALKSCGALIVEKPTFSACAEPAFRARLDSVDRPQVIVGGIETHVCVQQTALDLRTAEYDVFVCADAVGARAALDHETALARMRRAGVVVTTVESVLFELCNRCDTPTFKKLLEVIKSRQSVRSVRAAP